MWTEIIAIIISIISLGLSIYTLSKNRAILKAEKHSLILKKENKEVWIYFYLTNVGDRPTTIKEVDFYCDSHFMPKTQLLKVIDKTILGIGEDLPASTYPKYEALDFPSIIGPNTTIKLLAKLKFADKSVFERETKNDKLHYILRLKYSLGIFEQRL